MNYCYQLCYITYVFVVHSHFCEIAVKYRPTNFSLSHLNLHFITPVQFAPAPRSWKNFNANCETHTQPHLSCSLQLGAHLADYVQMTGKVHFQADVPFWINNTHVFRCRVHLKRSVKSVYANQANEKNKSYSLKP